jgi:hypothetical protein
MITLALIKSPSWVWFHSIRSQHVIFASTKKHAFRVIFVQNAWTVAYAFDRFCGIFAPFQIYFTV